jgi:hypothetical protein
LTPSGIGDGREIAPVAPRIEFKNSVNAQLQGTRNPKVQRLTPGAGTMSKSHDDCARIAPT